MASQAEIGEGGMVVGAAAERPVILPVTLPNRQVVDARDAPPHEAMLIELPVFVAVGTKPVAGIVMPLVGEAHGDAVAVESPQFLDQAIVQLLVPFAGQELHDGLAPGQKLRTIAPRA